MECLLATEGLVFPAFFAAGALLVISLPGVPAAAIRVAVKSACCHLAYYLSFMTLVPVPGGFTAIRRSSIVST